MDPIEFFHAHLGRHLLPQEEVTGDVVADVNRALTRTYQHTLTDRERALRDLQSIRNGDENAPTLIGWAKQIAAYEFGRELASDALLAAEEREALSKAAAKVKKVKAEMPGLRLSKSMLAVVREDRASLLIANVRPSDPSKIDHRLCEGMAIYNAALLDAVLLNPPASPFIVIEFDRSTPSVDQLRLNMVSGSAPLRVATSGPLGGVVDRRGVLLAIELSAGIDDRFLGRLAIWEEKRLRSGEGDWAWLDEMAREIPANVDDLLDTLPQRDTLEWRLLRLARRRHKNNIDTAAQHHQGA